jgi:hypothetical protein
MKKLIVSFACLAFGCVGAADVLSKEPDPVKTLPAVVAQVAGQANTVTIWHDIDDDGQADYKATYVFKDGKLHQLNKSHATQNELGYWIRRR